MIKGSSVDKGSGGKTYSTFVDNISHTGIKDLAEGGPSISRKSSTSSLHPQKGLPTTSSTSSFQRHYAKPPVVPTTTSPLHNRENFVAGTGSYSSSYFSALIWRLGASCCPCFGGRGAISDESNSAWQAIARQFVKKMAPSSANEGQQLIKRTKSEEEILKKRPKRKVASAKKLEDEDIISVTSGTKSESLVNNDIDVVDTAKQAENGQASQNPKSTRKVKPPPPVVKRKELQPSATNGSTANAATNGGARSKTKIEAKKVSEEKRSMSMSRLAVANDNFDQWSNKSGTPSPIISGSRIPHGITAARDLVRDFRESSVNSRSSADSFGIDPDFREDSVPRDDPLRHPSPFSRQLQHGGSTTSLGSRSESMLSIHSQEGGRYGTVIVRGEVEFSMAYSLHSASLDLAVKQCRDLAAVDSKRNRSDPYVKVYLLPDKSKSGKRKTKVKKHTLNPVFDEILKFQMPLVEVERRTLWLSVWHSDMFGRNDFLGEVMLPLNGQHLDDPTPKWYSLLDRTEPLCDDQNQGLTYRGEIIVALKFVPPGSDVLSSLRKSSGSSSRRSTSSSKRGSLLILVKEAKNLMTKGSGTPDPFCKCYLLPTSDRSSKQKTPVCRKTISPRWEHTLRWDDLTLSDLANSCLELTVWDHDRLPGRHNECLGGARFNLGTGKHYGRPVAWMDSSEKEVNLWQQMLDRPNFWVEGSVFMRASEKLNGSQAFQS